jgi:hypothetical protein
MPVLALGAAAVWDRIPRSAIAIVGAWTIGLVIHGVAYPWRLFHLFNGENAVGEWLSKLYRTDFSRLFPSFVRMNGAAWWGAAAVIALCAATAFLPRAWRGGAHSAPLTIAALALAIAAAFHVARQPGVRVEVEDAHVIHEGGTLYPETYTLMRTAYRGGWILQEGDSLSFLARKGAHRLDTITGLGATIEIAGRRYEVPVSDRYQSLRVIVPMSGRVTLRCLRGAVNVDRMDLDD